MDTKHHEDDEPQLHEAVLSERNETDWEGTDDAARHRDEAAQRGIVTQLLGTRGQGEGNRSITSIGRSGLMS